MNFGNKFDLTVNKLRGGREGREGGSEGGREGQRVRGGRGKERGQWFDKLLVISNTKYHMHLLIPY